MTIAWPTEDPDAPRQRPRKPWKWPVIAGGAVVVVIAAVAIWTPSRPEAGSPAAAVISTSPTTTSTTTTTTTTTTPPPPPPPSPEVFQGKGDDVVELKRGAAAGIVAFECPKCTGNVIVESDGRESLLVNTIGAYTGKHLINIADGSMTTSISVKAKGSWKLSVTGLDTIEVVTGKPASGRGDSVVMFADTFTSATVKNQGKSNFVVTYADLTTKRLGLAVNEIGSYQGTVKLPGPSIVQVESSGAWTITPK
ncbi:hypothetical protein DMH04_24680 [Kibdelosporangium aridum]|uniref:Uncharacterized protein n=1 Tax=Kibdelosporangium aridum TaxID=2030 RepID=A0A428Z6M3_KIBAR|nr:hypothetical protein [Kibdelosporangium aridum]RSM82808.1 hypothetical protein DMH04_24680 [Kibdelosporangium aridum]